MTASLTEIADLILLDLLYFVEVTIVIAVKTISVSILASSMDLLLILN